MKKLFTLLALSLCMATVAGAQTLTSSFIVDESTATSAKAVIYSGSEISMTLGDQSWAVNSSKVKAKGVQFTNYISGDGNPSGFVDGQSAPTGGTYVMYKPMYDGTLYSVAQNIGDSKNIYVCDGGGNTISCTLTAVDKNGDDGTVYNVGQGETTGAKINGYFTIPVTAGETYYVFMTGSKMRYMGFIYEYEETPSTDPKLSVSPATLSFSLSPMGNVECDTVTLKGSNLEDGIYYVEQPGVSGLYINPESFTVENGTVEQDFEIMYMTDADVEKATADFVFNVGDVSATLTVTYQSRASMYEQELVTEATTWNWESLTGPEVQLTEETNPKRSPEVGVVMANLEDLIPFNSDFTIEKAKQIVLINTQYPSRKKAMQNGMVKFTTNMAGTISVDFSDTGSSYSDSSPRYERYLNVNGVNTEFYTMRDGSKSDRKVAEGIAVEPGNVFIKARGVNPKDGNTEEADAAVMIYKITFTPDADAVADPSIEINDELAPAAGTATAIKNVTGERMMNNVRFNLAGQQVSKDYKGIVVRNGQKWMQK